MCGSGPPASVPRRCGVSARAEGLLLHATPCIRTHGGARGRRYATPLMRGAEREASQRRVSDGQHWG
eukprot:355645-Chlamydomonas_euryale.AAC.33